MNTLIQHHWPGNVKELQNCIERAVLVCDEEIIQSYHLPSSLRNQPSPTSLNALIENLEKSLIIEALKQHRGKQKSAAAYLGISPRVLNYKLQKYKIDADIFK
jgi:Nif-specific regulatory protein